MHRAVGIDHDTYIEEEGAQVEADNPANIVAYEAENADAGSNPDLDVNVVEELAEAQEEEGDNVGQGVEEMQERQISFNEF